MIKFLVSFFTLRITGKGLLFAAITVISMMASLVLLAVFIVKPNQPSLPEERKFAKWISGYEAGISYSLTGRYCTKERHYFMIRFDQVAITDKDIENYILPLHVTQVELNHTEVTCAGVGGSFM